ncbi:MAG: hypothetical protein SOZ89_04435 [Peptoniphilaceae bacterium]|nr:hypothetical protein [Peptoniphilaceae bacterium]MDY3738354.1 hypothetical protein [Peptoniphilaceae bacterium]
MDKIKDFLLVSKDAVKLTFNSVKKANYLFIFLIIYNIYNVIDYFFVKSFFAGILSYFALIFIFCFIVNILNSIVNYDVSGKNDITNSISRYYSPVINSVFTVYIIKYLINYTTSVLNITLISEIIIYVIFQIIISSILELIYIDEYYGFDIIIESIRFIYKNILIWLVDIIPFIIINEILKNKLFFLFLTQQKVNSIIIILILAGFHTIYLIFKGNLFKILKTSSFRKRQFERGFKF